MALSAPGRYTIRYPHEGAEPFAWFNSLPDAEQFKTSITSFEEGIDYVLEDTKREEDSQ